MHPRAVWDIQHPCSSIPFLFEEGVTTLQLSQWLPTIVSKLAEAVLPHNRHRHTHRYIQRTAISPAMRLLWSGCFGSSGRDPNGDRRAALLDMMLHNSVYIGLQAASDTSSSRPGAVLKEIGAFVASPEIKAEPLASLRCPPLLKIVWQALSADLVTALAEPTNQKHTQAGRPKLRAFCFWGPSDNFLDGSLSAALCPLYSLDVGSSPFA